MKTYEIKTIVIEPHKCVMLSSLQREVIELSAKEGVDVAFTFNDTLYLVEFSKLFGAICVKAEVA